MQSERLTPSLPKESFLTRLKSELNKRFTTGLPTYLPRRSTQPAVPLIEIFTHARPPPFPRRSTGKSYTEKCGQIWRCVRVIRHELYVCNGRKICPERWILINHSTRLTACMATPHFPLRSSSFSHLLFPLTKEANYPLGEREGEGEGGRERERVQKDCRRREMGG